MIKPFHSFPVCRSSHQEVFLGKGVLNICNKFTGEHPRESAISIKLLATLLKPHFGQGVLMWICCIFSEHLFLRKWLLLNMFTFALYGCFWICLLLWWQRLFLMTKIVTFRHQYMINNNLGFSRALDLEKLTFKLNWLLDLSQFLARNDGKCFYFPLKTFLTSK